MACLCRISLITDGQMRISSLLELHKKQTYTFVQQKKKVIRFRSIIWLSWALPKTELGKLWCKNYRQRYTPLAVSPTPYNGGVATKNPNTILLAQLPLSRRLIMKLYNIRWMKCV